VCNIVFTECGQRIFKCNNVRTISLGLSNDVDILEHFSVSGVINFQKLSILAIIAKSLSILHPRSCQSWWMNNNVRASWK